MNKLIREVEAEIRTAENKKAYYQKQLAMYQDYIQKLDDKLANYETNLGNLKEQNKYKRACQALDKKYWFISIDEIDEDGVLWFSCDFYNEDNEEEDPYYDDHYAYDWVALHERFNVYIDIAREKEVI